MSGLDKIKSFMGILDKVATPEAAVALKGAEREEYLKALDQMFGPRDKRATDMGFGKETWYHGGPVGQEELIPSHANHEIGSGVYLASDKKGAYGFTPPGADPYELRVKGKSLDLGAWPEDQEAARSLLDRGGMSEGEINALYEEGHNDPHHRPDEAKAERFQDANRILKKHGYSGIESGWESGSQRTVVDPKNLRSTEAAFDPRFKDSAKLLAGAGVIPAAMKPDTTVNPLDYMKQGFDAYEDMKNNLTGKLAKQMAPDSQYVPPEVAKSTRDQIQGIANFGLDPLNAIPGEPGMAAMALQSMAGLGGKKQVEP